MFGYSRDYRSTGRRESSGSLSPTQEAPMPAIDTFTPAAAAAVAGLTPRQREIVDEHVRDDVDLSIDALLELFEDRYWEEEDSDPGLAEEFAAIGVALKAARR